MRRVRVALLAVSLGVSFLVGAALARRRPPPVVKADTLPPGTRLLGGGCLKDGGGCPSVSPLPKCSTLAGTRDVADLVKHLHNFTVGERVTLRGPLRKQGGAVCSNDVCKTGCCKHCQTRVFMGAPDADAAHRVLLADLHDPSLFACHGDESLTCCGVPAEGEDVVVTGAFVKANVVGGVYQLDIDSICKP